jgi:hypothetical protein
MRTHQLRRTGQLLACRGSFRSIGIYCRAAGKSLLDGTGQTGPRSWSYYVWACDMICFYLGYRLERTLQYAPKIQALCEVLQ